MITMMIIIMIMVTMVIMIMLMIMVSVPIIYFRKRAGLLGGDASLLALPPPLHPPTLWVGVGMVQGWESVC